jgi:hypothetical protein
MRRQRDVSSPRRGLGILANEDANPVGWKPMPLIPRANQTTSKQGCLQHVDSTFSAPCSAAPRSSIIRS